MKYLITTIAALVLVGCGPSVDIHEAARTGNIEAVKRHLATGADVNAKRGDGRTPLHFAVANDHKEVAALLIAKGADVNAEDSSIWTPLRNAAYKGHKEIVELLIAEGADVNAKDQKGKTPLDTAYGQTADLLRKHGGKTGEELEAAGN